MSNNLQKKFDPKVFILAVATIIGATALFMGIFYAAVNHLSRFKFSASPEQIYTGTVVGLIISAIMITIGFNSKKNGDLSLLAVIKIGFSVPLLGIWRMSIGRETSIMLLGLAFFIIGFVLMISGFMDVKKMQKLQRT